MFGDIIADKKEPLTLLLLIPSPHICTCELHMPLHVRIILYFMCPCAYPAVSPTSQVHIMMWIVCILCSVYCALHVTCIYSCVARMWHFIFTCALWRALSCVCLWTVIRMWLFPRLSLNSFGLVSDSILGVGRIGTSRSDGPTTSDKSDKFT